MEFGNESDERARDAEARVRDLVDEIGRMSEELQIRKREIEIDQMHLEEMPFVTHWVYSDCLDFVHTALLAERNISFGFPVRDIRLVYHLCSRFPLPGSGYRTLCDRLKPSTQKFLSLVSKANKFETEKECIIQNLVKAKQEAELVSMQNRKLDKENRKLLRQQSPPVSAETSHKSASAKSHKRKSLKMMSSPIEKKLEFSSSPEISKNTL
ncbi:hypothetical protein Bca52824_058415 [Brassica carinata]|uniref:Uncharacterized protein n=1 Tax=Brassica carinata TaxID=52824 RepID=A0A8X7QWA0_BRACI|nr:hypothetical protein Bca52824_058415 [Brassica carinata]